MEMNSALFDELAASYKSDRQRYEEHTVMFVFFKQPCCLQSRLNAHFFSGKERRTRNERISGGSWRTWSSDEESRTATASFPPNPDLAPPPCGPNQSLPILPQGPRPLFASHAPYFTAHSLVRFLPFNSTVNNPLPLSCMLLHWKEEKIDSMYLRGRKTSCTPCCIKIW